MAILNPHFDLPFRLSGSSFATVEQDSPREISNCVETIVRTPYGFRDDTPEFGFPYDAFETMPIGTSEIKSVIESQEPRSDLSVTEQMNLVDDLIDELRIETGVS